MEGGERRRWSTGNALSGFQAPQDGGRARRGSTGSVSVAEFAASAVGLSTMPTAAPGRRGSRTDMFGSQPVSNLRRKNSIQIQSDVGLAALNRSSFLDEGLEAIVGGEGLRHPPCCEPCAKSSLVEFLLNPADHATRHKRRVSEDDETGDGQGAQYSHGNSRRYGWKDFSQAGFALIPPSDLEIPDRTVMLILNLRVAVHRKTSVQRYCHMVQKSKVAAGRIEVKNTVRQLLRCNHINVLRLHEVFEDESTIYLLYEYWPCVTLMTMMEQADWSESDMANMARECGCAIAHALSFNIYHLGFSLYHILLPPDGKPRPLKVFGFGLAGVFAMEAGDKQFWSPESAEKFMQFRGNHLQKLEVPQKWPSDSWSLGCIVYSIIARKPPIIGGADNILAKVSSRQWTFSAAFNDCDVEAKSMIEALLDPLHDRRLRAERAYQHEWIRKRKGNAHPAAVTEAYEALHAFCESPKSKKLFGRFLVRFLSAEQRREISARFTILDSKGDGFLDKAELEQAAVQAKRPRSSVNVIVNWFDIGTAPEKCLAFSQYCETLAEDVIDGRALRHAFESLDEDGSEEITAEELWDVLKSFDASLTLEDVVKHVEAAESDANAQGAEGNADNALSFAEFTRLFPVRMERLASLESRVQSAKGEAECLFGKFKSVEDPIQLWIDNLQNIMDKLVDLAKDSIDQKKDGYSTAKSIRSQLTKASDCLKNPPGAKDFDAVTLRSFAKDNAKKTQNKSKKVSKFKAEEEQFDCFGFDNFLQMQSHLEGWQTSVVEEGRVLKDVLLAAKVQVSGNKEGKVDRFKAHDGAGAAINKIEGIITWTKQQLLEYQSFSDAMMTFETPLPSISMSGRGIRKVDEEEEDEDADEDVVQSKGALGKLGLIGAVFEGKSFNSIFQNFGDSSAAGG